MMKIKGHRKDVTVTNQLLLFSVMGTGQPKNWLSLEFSYYNAWRWTGGMSHYAKVRLPFTRDDDQGRAWVWPKYLEWKPHGGPSRHLKESELRQIMSKAKQLQMEAEEFQDKKGNKQIDVTEAKYLQALRKKIQKQRANW